MFSYFSFEIFRFSKFLGYSFVCHIIIEGEKCYLFDSLDLWRHMQHSLACPVTYRRGGSIRLIFNGLNELFIFLLANQICADPAH